MDLAKLMKSGLFYFERVWYDKSMWYYFIILIAGFGGGVVRGLVGYIKHQYSYKNVGFNLPYFFAMMFLSGIIGVTTAMAIKEFGLSFLGVEGFSSALAFIIGYAGGDFIDNIYKIITKGQVLSDK